jgi:hypothetical protein
MPPNQTMTEGNDD